MNKTIISSFKIAVSGIGLISTFFTIIDLMNFLSNPYINEKNIDSDQNVQNPWSWALLFNMFLISIFILQHSFLALPQIKEIYAKYQIQDLQRSIYIIITCITLEIVFKNWQYTSDFYLWNFDMQNKFIWFGYFIMHIFSWLFIYIGSICMDINELIGIKQIYYSVQNLPEPISYKSFELQRLYAHMRHPSFLAFLILFWTVPVMRLDRLLLASTLSTYMFVAWKTDKVDYHYQKIQYSKKFQ